MRDHPNIRVPLEVKDDFPMDPMAPRSKTALRYTAEGSTSRNDMQLMASSFSSPVAGDPLEAEGIRFTCILELANGAVEGDILPGTGHFMHQEKPQEVNPRILEFLKR